jgi:hypothetical protein
LNFFYTSKIGGIVVEPKSEQENNLIGNFAKQYFEGEGEEGEIWIGVNDLAIEEE